MKLNHLLLIIAFIAIQPITAQEEASTVDTTQKTTVYYFIRHAEKDRSDSSNKNPDLTAMGQLRAKNWSKVFTHVDLDAVYSTSYNRTEQTAAPVARSKELELQSYDPRDLYSAAFRAATVGKTVLVVGHSNTTPAFVNTILKEERFPNMDDSNNGALYIVTLVGDQTTVQVLQIN
ncbi:MAG: histidine phosphatase family protein [Gilvibacter sp.]